MSAPKKGIAWPSAITSNSFAGSAVSSSSTSSGQKSRVGGTSKSSPQKKTRPSGGGFSAGAKNSAATNNTQQQKPPVIIPPQKQSYFPECNIEQVLCKKAQREFLIKQKANWMRQRNQEIVAKDGQSSGTSGGEG